MANRARMRRPWRATFVRAARADFNTKDTKDTKDTKGANIFVIFVIFVVFVSPFGPREVAAPLPLASAA